MGSITNIYETEDDEEAHSFVLQVSNPHPYDISGLKVQ